MRGPWSVWVCLFALSFGLVGCTQYWVKPGTNLQDTAKDLSDCRVQANQGGQKVFSAQEMEAPCMTAKGYSLSNRPPK